jgi:hypothetical protein
MLPPRTAHPGRRRGLLVLAAAVALAPAAAAAPAPNEPACFRVPAPGGWAMTPDNVTLILAQPAEAKLHLIDTVNNKLVKSVEVDFKPGPMAIQGNTLFVAGQGSALVYALDLTTLKPVKEYNVGGDAVARLACHPTKGLLYATSTSLKVSLIDPASGAVTLTKARGDFIAVDPVSGNAVYTGFQPPRDEDEFTFREGADGRVKFMYDRWGTRAVILKYAVVGRNLTPVSAQRNAAVNGWSLALSPDGKRVALMGGGGWRPPITGGGGSGGGYVCAVFSTDNLETMVGQAPHGGDIVFHPVLNLGMVGHTATDLTLFNAKSLTAKRGISIAAGPPAEPLIEGAGATAAGGRPLAPFTFAAKGTKFVFWSGENPKAPREGLHLIPLELTDEERAVLQKVYGDLPPKPAPGSLASASPAPGPGPARPSAPSRPTPPATVSCPPAPAMPPAPVVQDNQFTAAKVGVPYMADRGYTLKALAPELEGSQMFVRNSGTVKNWLGAGQLPLDRDCTVYLAILWRVNEREVVNQAAFQALQSGGWSIVGDDALATTPPGTERWEWRVVNRPQKKAAFDPSVKVPMPSTHYIYLVK